ncbi:oxygenase MpaB family protein [Streptomyces evansiae]|uniref:oxygenase MpaB family protein n=1 Tax=Streptomyces evansiae TaxID=3075535 RepID=UPI00288622E6|nr:oxygenase MpaB family protein [Streptomyces sp. DSM 41859]MDT0421103.1 oxygenase MpaB family protein [Streptomyces sp. DSM 41859]
MAEHTVLEALRERAHEALFARVAGPSARAVRARIHETPGPRWFGPGRPIRVVHGDASMFVGGLAALLLQSLHPLAMAAVAAHSGYRGDPWGRLRRTSTFLATTTFATADDAERAVTRVREVHEGVRGTAPDGRPYHAADPELLRWVHVAEVSCFLGAHERYGAHPLDAAGADGYVADAARVAEALGATEVPHDRAALDRCLDAYRPALRRTPEALDVARYLLREPPLPAPARPPYAGLVLGAIETLPPWARARLGLRPLSAPGAVVSRAAGRGVTHAIRWALGG